MAGYDIIGDVHGYAGLLKKLLLSMGYSLSGKCWSHPDRKAIFVGDFINRGPEIRETLDLIYHMVEGGHAYAILGNHEYRAILYHLKDDEGMFMSRHVAGNRNQIQKTLLAFKNDKEQWKFYLKWMRKLPLYLEFEDFRVVHAYWNDEAVRQVDLLFPEKKLKKSLLKELHRTMPDESSSVYQLVKGLEFKCPRDLIIRCNKGLSRKIFNINWWESPEGKTFRNLTFGNKFTLPDYDIPSQLAPHFDPYLPDQPNLFIGHYCMADGATLLQSNICCLDSCVDSTGVLSAYRWSGEKILDTGNLVSVSDLK